jgi:hypothetical protein
VTAADSLRETRGARQDLRRRDLGLWRGESSAVVSPTSLHLRHHDLLLQRGTKADPLAR